MVLKAIGKTLQTSFRATDITARMGGEEFAIISPGVSKQALPEFLEKIRKAVSDLSFKANGIPFTITTSIGAINCAAESLEEMISVADEMLYESKSNGRDRVTIADQDYVDNRSSLETDATHLV